MRLIDADALIENCSWDADTRVGYVQVVDVGDIENATTIDPVKHGPQHKIFLFSKRKALADKFDEWCLKTHASNCPLNVVTFLYSNGLLDLDRVYEKLMNGKAQRKMSMSRYHPNKLQWGGRHLQDRGEKKYNEKWFLNTKSGGERMGLMGDDYNVWNDWFDEVTRPLEPLKPCPCCGGEAWLRDNGYMEPEIDGNGAYVGMDVRGGDILWVECQSCGLTTSQAGTPEEAVALWNRRQASASAPAVNKSPCAVCGFGGKHLDAPPCTFCPAYPKEAADEDI